MPKFTIDHNSNHNAEEAYKKVKEFLSNDDELRRFDPKMKVQFDDGSRTCNLFGGQFKADMCIATNGNGSKVSVTVDLPLMLSPFKGKVQETLQKKLTKYLG
jgi:hypothetical protein